MIVRQRLTLSVIPSSSAPNRSRCLKSPETSRKSWSSPAFSLMTASGLLISWATPAATRPSEASFSTSTSCSCLSCRLSTASSSEIMVSLRRSRIWVNEAVSDAISASRVGAGAAAMKSPSATRCIASSSSRSGALMRPARWCAAPMPAASSTPRTPAAADAPAWPSPAVAITPTSAPPASASTKPTKKRWWMLTASPPEGRARTLLKDLLPPHHPDELLAVLEHGHQFQAVLHDDPGGVRDARPGLDEGLPRSA